MDTVFDVNQISSVPNVADWGGCYGVAVRLTLLHRLETSAPKSTRYNTDIIAFTGIAIKMADDLDCDETIPY
jgi:hypothetical protein